MPVGTRKDWDRLFTIMFDEAHVERYVLMTALLYDRYWEMYRLRPSAGGFLMYGFYLNRDFTLADMKHIMRYRTSAHAPHMLEARGLLECVNRVDGLKRTKGIGWDGVNTFRVTAAGIRVCMEYLKFMEKATSEWNPDRDFIDILSSPEKFRGWLYDSN